MAAPHQTPAQRIRVTPAADSGGKRRIPRATTSPTRCSTRRCSRRTPTPCGTPASRTTRGPRRRQVLENSARTHVRARACCAHPCAETHKHAHPHSQMRTRAHAHPHTHTHTHTHRHARTHTSTPTHPHSHTRARTAHPQTPTWTHTCAPVHVYLSIST